MRELSNLSLREIAVWADRATHRSHRRRVRRERADIAYTALLSAIWIGLALVFFWVVIT